MWFFLTFFFDVAEEETGAERETVIVPQKTIRPKPGDLPRADLTGLVALHQCGKPSLVSPKTRRRKWRKSWKASESICVPTRAGRCARGEQEHHAPVRKRVASRLRRLRRSTSACFNADHHESTPVEIQHPSNWTRRPMMAKAVKETATSARANSEGKKLTESNLKD